MIYRNAQTALMRMMARRADEGVGRACRQDDPTAGRRIAKCTLVVMLGLHALPQWSSAHADQIVTATENYRGAKIVGFEGGEVRLRTSKGRLRGEWIDQIKLIVVDRSGLFDDFNQAERFFAEGQPARAIVRYRRTVRLSEDFWSDLIAARLVLACDAAGQLDTAVLNWLRLLAGAEGGPAAAARLLPQSIPTQRNQRVTRAVQQLDSALAANVDDSRHALIEVFRFEILRRSGDDSTDRAAARATSKPLAADVGTPRVYEIVLHALSALLTNDASPDALNRLNRAISNCPEDLLPGFLLLKGETMLRAAATPQDLTRAAWPMMRVAIHFPDHPRAAEGLLGAAVALERMGKTVKAGELLAECLSHPRLSDATRRTAEAAQARLRSKLTPVEK